MRLLQPFAQRPQYYDRNPLQVSQNFTTGGTPPHGSTSRWSYTVPSNRKAFITSAACNVHRATVATTAAEVQGNIQIGNAPPCTCGEFWQNSNVLDNFVQGSVPLTAIMLAGEQGSALTQDLSTGGSMGYSMGWKGIEFDA